MLGGEESREGLFGAVGDERRQERDLVWSSRKAPLLKFLSIVFDNRLSEGKSSFATPLGERSNMEAPGLCGQVAREGEAVPWHETRGRHPYCCRITTTSHYRNSFVSFYCFIVIISLFCKTLKPGLRIPSLRATFRVEAALILGVCRPPDICWHQS